MMELEQLHPDAQQMVNRFEQKEDFEVEALVMVMKLALQSYETSMILFNHNITQRND